MKRHVFVITLSLFLFFLCACGMDITALPASQSPDAAKTVPISTPEKTEARSSEPSPSPAPEPAQDAIDNSSLYEVEFADFKIAENAFFPDGVQPDQQYTAYLLLEGLSDSQAEMAAMLGVDVDSPKLVHYDNTIRYGGFTSDGYEYENVLGEDNYDAESVSELYDKCTKSLEGYFAREILASPVLEPACQYLWDTETKQWRSENDALKMQGGHHLVTYEHRVNGIPIMDINEGLFVSASADNLAIVRYAWHNFSQTQSAVKPMPLTEAIQVIDPYRSENAMILGARLVYSNLTHIDRDRLVYDLHWRITTEYQNYYVNCNTGAYYSDGNT